jgi:AraC family transcriptional regulator of adaptative response / DNA-3-methyladenine glycosylase II
VPGAWAPFEIAVQAVIRDQSPAEADGLLAGLVQVAGTPVPGLDHGLTHAFPSAEAVYSAPHTAGETVQSLAAEVAAGNIKLDGGESLEELVASLTAVRGITEQAAHEIALRLGARDAFPGTPTPESEAWRPWRALANIHLLAARR